ncbi:MAG: transglycosylase SLT domain-containing protein [Candidatus Rokuibacteriota bacterium]
MVGLSPSCARLVALLLSAGLVAWAGQAVAWEDHASPAVTDPAEERGADSIPGDPEAEADDLAALRLEVEALRERLDALREHVVGVEARLSGTPPALHTFRPPESIVFAGEPVLLDRWDVAERLEREFYLALGDPAQVILWLKRSARYFPYIEAELRAAGLPDDLKYVAVAESALRPRAYSYAQASGLWQFIPATARRYGLRVAAGWDDRRDPGRATAAALAYLRDLHQQFGTWPLALAGYNVGENRVAGEMKQQGVGTYYQLVLPTETERYVFRVLAAKLIIEGAGRYGFEVPPEERYAPHAADLVTLRVVGHLGVRELAEAAGSFYRETKTLNPAILGDDLPAGRYELRIPKGRLAEFTGNLPALERLMAARAVRRVRYRVRPGDTLSDIARRFGVTVEILRAGNAAARRSHIRPGDVLVIGVSGKAAR